MDITRRQTIQLISGTAAALTVPIQGVAAPSADLVALRERVQAVVDRFNPAPSFAHAQYGQIFKHASARVDACKDCDARLEHGVTHTSSTLTGQRWVFATKHDEVSLGFTVTPSMSDADVTAMLTALAQSMKEHRELSAVGMFNKPTTYFASVGGDGQPLCSREHPCDLGMWSNRMTTDCDLVVESLRAALQSIRDTFVDEANLRIVANGIKLIVPVALMPNAERAVSKLAADEFPQFSREYFVWDYLRSNEHWFVLTDIPGLIWSERRPFAMHVRINATGDGVEVIGDEKRGFGYHDPRAVFASLPT